MSHCLPLARLVHLLKEYQSEVCPWIQNSSAENNFLLATRVPSSKWQEKLPVQVRSWFLARSYLHSLGTLGQPWNPLCCDCLFSALRKRSRVRLLPSIAIISATPGPCCKERRDESIFPQEQSFSKYTWMRLAVTRTSRQQKHNRIESVQLSQI